MAYIARYGASLSADTTRSPSANLWKDCPIVGMICDPGVGYFAQDHFLNVPTLSTSANTGLYATYLDTGGTARQGAAAAGGTLTLTSDGTLDDETWLTAGGNLGSPFIISDTAGSDRKLWFEARWKVSTVTDTVCAVFVGLAEEGLAAANTKIDSTGAFASKDVIGFETVHADNDALNWMYRLAGQTLVNKISGVAALTADTYIKTGFKYDPKRPTTKRIACYINGQEQSTYVTGANIATATGSAFPDAQGLTFLIGGKTGAGAAVWTITCDWYRVAQLI